MKAGKTVFVNNGCGSCHTFKPAAASGKVGPDLDKLAEYAKAARQEVGAFTEESIVKPDAYIEKGFPAHVMPATFDQLPKDRLNALVRYLVAGGKGSQ